MFILKSVLELITMLKDDIFLSQFDTKGSGPGQLSYPLGIVIDDNSLMYITELDNHCISIFTTDGQFVQYFRGQHSSVVQFNYPYGITFNREGYLYIVI